MVWVWLALSGCGPLSPVLSEAPPPRTALPPPTTEDGSVWTATVTTTPRSVPPRFAAGLPPDLATWRHEPDAWPTRGHLAHAVCTDEAARETLWLRIEGEPSGGWGALLEGCGAPEACGWALQRLSSGVPEADVLWPSLLDCSSASAAIASPRAPDPVVILWAFEHGNPSTDRVEAALRRMLQAPEEPYPGILGLYVLGQETDPAAGRALARLHATVHPDFRDRVALAMWGRDDPELARLHHAACARIPDPQCGLQRIGPHTDLYAALREGQIDPGDLLERLADHSSRVADALEGCAREQRFDDPQLASDCLWALGRVDLQRAQRLVGSLGEPGLLFPVVHSLELGPSALQQELAGLGLGPFPTSDEPPLSALGWLQLSGEALAIGRLDEPAALEQSLRRMASLAGAREILFQEIPPDRGNTLPGRAAYTTLYAWADGLRFRTLADDQGPWWGLEHAVGLLNAVLERRGAEARLAVASEGTTLFAVAAPPEALARLGGGQLIHWEDPPEPGAEPSLLDTGLGR